MAKLTEAYLKNLIKKVMKESMVERPREELRIYLTSHTVEAVFRAIDEALLRAEETGEKPTSEDITFNPTIAALLDALPNDGSLHGMLDAVLDDEFSATAYADAEADRMDVKDTQHSLTRGIYRESRKASGGGYKR
jgi:hypothetical protein